MFKTSVKMCGYFLKNNFLNEKKENQSFFAEMFRISVDLYENVNSS